MKYSKLRFTTTLTLFFFSWTQTVGAEEWQGILAQQSQFEQELGAIENQKVPASPAGGSDTAMHGVRRFEDSQDFLEDTLTLSKVTHGIDYDYERYDFENALDLLRPEYATAVILKEIKKEDIEKLLALDFEVAIVVLHGEIVLFTTGNEEEIGVTRPARKILERSSFISHTHIENAAQNGPSSFDLKHAVAAPGLEYVLTRQGIFAYHRDGLLNEGKVQSYEKYLEALMDPHFRGDDMNDNVQARADLNEFIREMDLINEETAKAEIFRASAAPVNPPSVNAVPAYTNTPLLTLSGTKPANTSIWINGVERVSLNSSTAWTFTVTLSGEQLYSFSITAKDSTGNQSTAANVSTTLDTTAPSGSVKINNDAVYTASLNVTLALTGTDTLSGLDQMRFSTDSGVTWTAWENAASSKALTLPGGSAGPTLTYTAGWNNYLGKGDKWFQSSTAQWYYLLPNDLALYVWPGGAVIGYVGPGVYDNPASLTELPGSGGNGTKTVQYQLRDKAGNAVTFTDDIILDTTLTPDTTPPTGSIDINSGASSTNSQTVTLNLSASDGTGWGLDKMSFSNDGSTWSAPEAFASSKSYQLPAGNGSKTVYVRFYDKAGNISQAYSKSILLGTQVSAPTVTAIPIYTNNASLALSGTKPANTSIWVNGVERVSLNSSTAWTYTAILSGEQLHSFSITAKDSTGTQSAPVSVSTTLDTVAPTGSLVINNNAAQTTSRDVSLTLTGSDATAGIDQMRFSTDNGTTWTGWEAFAASKNLTLPDGNGNKTVQYQVKDKAGNISQAYSKSIILNIQVSAPTVAAIPVYTNSANLALSGTKPANTSIWINGVERVSLNSSTAWTYTATLSGDQLHSFAVTAKDSTGNQSTAANVSTTLDTTAPSGSVKINNDAVYTASLNVTLALTGTDTLSGLDQMRFSTDSGVTWTAWENAASSKALTLPGGSAGPTLTYTAGWNNYLGKGDKWFLKDGTAQWYYLLPNDLALYVWPGGAVIGYVAPGVYDNPASLTELPGSGGNGTKSVQYQLRDKAGNAVTFTDDIILDTTLTPDTTPPTGSININSGAASTNSQTVTLNLSASDGTGWGVDKMSFSNDGSTWSAPEVFATSKSYSLPAGNGSKTVYVRFYDKAGNISQIYSKSILLGTQVSAPTVTAIPAYMNSTSLVLSGTKPANTSIWINGVERVSLNSSTAWTYTAALSGEQLHSFSVTAKDTSGNQSPAANVSTTLDTVAPTGSLAINNNATQTTSRDVTLTLTGSDATAGLDQMRFSTDNGTTWTGWETFATSKNLTLPDGNGNKTVQYQVKDKAGNISQAYSKSIILNIQVSAPTVATISVYTNSASLVLSGTKAANTSIWINGVERVGLNSSTAWTYTAALSGEQLHSFSVTAKDTSGNQSPAVSVSTTLDTVAPSGSVKINNDAVYTASRNVTLALTGTDTLSGVDQMRFSTDSGVTWTAWENAASSKALTLPGGSAGPTLTYTAGWNNYLGKGDKWFQSSTAQWYYLLPNDLALYGWPGGAVIGYVGPGVYDNPASLTELPGSGGNGTKTVQYQLRDKAGNAVIFTDDIILDITLTPDTTPPTGSIDINSGAASTNSQTVTLNLSASDGTGWGLDKMSFSNDGSTWSAPEAFASSKSYQLPAGNGSKTVYVRFYDKAGNISQIYSKSILLGTQVSAPTVTAIPVYTNSASLVLSGTKPANTSIWINGVERVSLNSSTAWTYTATLSGDQLHSFSITAKDSTGTQSPAANVSTTLDTTAPSASLRINNDAAYTNQGQVTLNLTASDSLSGLGQMRFTTDTTNWIWTEWENFHATKTLTLPPGDGTKQVFWQIYDKAWNLTSSSDSIILDTVAPAGTFVVNNGAAYTNNTSVNLQISVTDSGSGLDKMSFAINSTDATAFSAWETFSATKALTLPNYQGPNYVNIKIRDKAGNEIFLWKSIIVDTVDPTATGMVINSNAQYANALSLTMNLTASDATSGVGEARFSTDGILDTEAWQTFSPAMPFSIPAGEGTRQIWGQVRDRAGRVSGVVTDTVIMDTIKPATSLLSSRYSFDRNYELRYDVKDIRLEGSYDGIERVELAKGRNEFTRTFKDLAGNVTNAKWVIYLDETAERGAFLDYDPNGNITSRVDPNGRETKYEYDANNRVTKMTYAEGSSVRYTYNERGDRTSMQDSAGTTFYLYDSANRLVRLIQPTGQLIDYNYDNASNLTEMIYGGVTIKYAYDATNRLIEVRQQKTGQADKVTSYTYNDAGDLSSKTLPNGIRTRTNYDTTGRLIEIVHEKVNTATTATHLASYIYTLDAADNRTQIIEKRGSGASQTTRTLDYTYDLFGRLTKEIDSSRGATNYTYDIAGNRLAREFTPSTITAANPRILTSYTYGLDNRLLGLVEGKFDAAGNVLESRTETFTYDAAGNMIQKIAPEKTIHYEYDSESRLVLWTDEKDFVEFFYDGDGNRTAKRVNGELTYYVVDPNREISQVLAELDSTGSVKQTYTYGLERLSTTAANPGTSFYLQDGLGSTIGVAQEGAGITGYSYDAFGNLLAGSPTLPFAGSSFLYAGEQLDPETGLVYLRARYYDPSLGRFFSRDPVLGRFDETQSFNPYLYVQNNPINFVDPLGLAPGDWWDPRSYNRARQIGLEVKEESIRKFLDEEKRLFGNSALHNTPGDAWRHARWNERMTKELSRSVSSIVGYGYEVWDQITRLQPFKELRMDLYNNKQGRSGKSADVLLKEGRLWTNVDDRKNNWKNYYGGSPPGGGGSSSGFTGLGSSFGRSLLGSYRSGSRGGVLLDKALSITGTSINDITGVTFDPYTGQVVLLGEAGGAVPEIPMDYLIEALQAVFGTQQDPGVTIDPQLGADGKSDWTKDQLVKHFGSIEDTELGWVVYEADRLMKSLNLGKDNITKSTITQDGRDISESFVASKIPDFKNMLTLWTARGGTAEKQSRFWFVPKEMKLVRSAGRDTFVFDNNSVQLLTEDLLVGNLAEDPDAKAYADFFTTRYDKFAALYPVFEELKKASRAVALAKFIWDHQIPVDVSWLQNTTLPGRATPRTTPVGENSNGIKIIRGGVTVDFINGLNFSYLSDTLGVAAGIRANSLGVRPTDLATQWNFNSGGKTYDASALSLAPTRKDANFYYQEPDLSFDTTGDFDLEWRRIYDSFSASSTRLGFGWRFSPYTIESTETSRTYVVNATTGAKRNLYPRLRFSDRTSQQTEDMVLVGFLSDGTPVYNPDGALTSTFLTMNPDNSFNVNFEDRRKVHFLADGRLDFLADQNANKIQYGYDASGRLSSMTDVPSGRQISLVYDLSGRVSQVNGPEGKSMTYTYDSLTGDLKTATESWTGRTATYAYDTSHRLLKATDHTGKVLFVNTYDEIGRLKSQVDGDGNSKQVAPNLLTHQTLSTDPLNGAQSKQTYDSLMRLTSTRDALGNQTGFTYGGAYGPTSILDPRGNITGMAYNTLGLEKSETDPLGHISRFDYSAGFGDARLVFNQEGTGFGQYFEYDNTGNLKSLTEGAQPVRDANGNLTSFYVTNLKTQYTYDLKGNLASVLDANSNATNYLYDSVGNITKITDARGMATGLTYETAGTVPTKRLASIKDPLSRFVNFTYDPVNEKVNKISTAAGETRYAYDTRDRISQITDALNRSTQFKYRDSIDKITETREIGNVSNPLDDIVAAFDYDRFGNLTSLAGPLGGATSFTYDLLNRLTRTLSPETTPLTKVEQARVDSVTSTSAKIRFNASETVSRAMVRVNEAGRRAFKTVTLEGPLSGDLVFEVDGLQVGTQYEYEIEVIDPEAHHAVTRKRSFQTEGTPPAETVIKSDEKIVGQVWNVTQTTAEIGVFDPDVNYNLVKEYKITYVPKAGGTSTAKTFAPIYQGTDGKYYITSVAKLENLSANTEYNFTLEVVNYPSVPFNKPAPHTGTFRTANPADTVPAAIQKNIVTPEVDRATVEFQTSEPLLWAAIAVVDYFTGERRDYTSFKPGSSGKLLIPNLKPETTYIYRIFTKDLSGNESVSDIPIFTTKGFDGASPLVLKSRVTEKMASTAKIEILTDEIPEALTVEYREKNTPAWLSSTAVPTARKTVISLAGLMAGKNYEYRVRARDASNNRVIEEWRDLVLFQEPALAVKEDPSGIFQLALNSTILAQAAQSGIVGGSLELSKKYLSAFKDKYDYLVFIPTLSGGKRLSLETKNSTSDNNTGSFYLGAQNNVKGIGQSLFDERPSFGSSSTGEFEGMVFLDSGLSSGPDFRFSSSDFTRDRNRILWQNVLTQELAHRFGSFLTSAAGNPFGMLGRALAHWGVFFDADFSPLDGNDWVDNGNGTFTLKRSYIVEAAFKRSTIGMPYNDLDLYAMGLLDPNKIQAPFVIENPRLQDGRKLRMHSSGNLVEIQNPDGTWSGPYYLSSDTVVQGTKRNITLQDIVNLEGPRNPSPSASQKGFNVAFINLTNEEESSLDSLEMTQKLSRFKDSFTRFFRDMARNLGNLLFPKGETAGSGGAVGVSTGSGFGIASPAPSLRGGLQADEAISEFPSLLYSHPFGDSGMKPFEPLDLNTLKPVDFDTRLTRLLPSSYSLDTLKTSFGRAALAALGPTNLFGHLSFSTEVLAAALMEVPALATFQLSGLPANLLTDVFEADLLKNIEKPVLLSELREQNLISLREAFPDPNRSSLPQPLPLFFDSESIRLPIQSVSGPVLIPVETPTSAPAPLLHSNTTPALDKPRLSFHTPLIWNALADRNDEEEKVTENPFLSLIKGKLKLKKENFITSKEFPLYPQLLVLNSPPLPVVVIKLAALPPTFFTITQWWQNITSPQKASPYKKRLQKSVRLAEKSGEPINMKEIMDFDWDRLYIFGPYTPNERISEEIGFEWQGLSFEDQASEGLCFLLFVKDKQVAHNFKYSRGDGDFSEAYQKGGYLPKEAIFIVKKGPISLLGHLPLVLKVTPEE